MIDFILRQKELEALSNDKCLLQLIGFKYLIVYLFHLPEMFRTELFESGEFSRNEINSFSTKSLCDMIGVDSSDYYQWKKKIIKKSSENHKRRRPMPKKIDIFEWHRRVCLIRERFIRSEGNDGFQAIRKSVGSNISEGFVKSVLAGSGFKRVSKARRESYPVLPQNKEMLCWEYAVFTGIADGKQYRERTFVFIISPQTNEIVSWGVADSDSSIIMQTLIDAIEKEFKYCNQTAVKKRKKMFIQEVRNKCDIDNEKPYNIINSINSSNKVSLKEASLLTFIQLKYILEIPAEPLPTVFKNMNKKHKEMSTKDSPELLYGEVDRDYYFETIEETKKSMNKNIWEYRILAYHFYKSSFANGNSYELPMTIYEYFNGRKYNRRKQLKL